MTTYSEWHTLTVAHDGENEDGTPCLNYELAHADNCPADTVPDPDEFPCLEPRCHLELLIREWSHMHEEYGIPTEPGTYRARSWYSPGEWYGASYCEPEDGIEIDDEQAARA